MLELVTHLQAQVAELTDIVKVQVETSNQTTELLGRLLATASGRLESVEDSLRQVRQAGAAAPASSESPESRLTMRCRHLPPPGIRRGAEPRALFQYDSGPVVLDLQSLQNPGRTSGGPLRTPTSSR